MKTAAVLFLTFCSILTYAQNNVPADTTKSVRSFRPFYRSYRSVTIKAFGGFDPLYVVDGHVVTVEEFDEIDNDNIESVSVLRNGAAEKLYGDKARNGVVLIQMKENSFGPKKN